MKPFVRGKRQATLFGDTVRKMACRLLRKSSDGDLVFIAGHIGSPVSPNVAAKVPVIRVVVYCKSINVCDKISAIDAAKDVVVTRESVSECLRENC